MICTDRLTEPVTGRQGRVVDFKRFSVVGVVSQGDGRVYATSLELASIVMEVSPEPIFLVVAFPRAASVEFPPLLHGTLGHGPDYQPLTVSPARNIHVSTRVSGLSDTLDIPCSINQRASSG